MSLSVYFSVVVPLYNEEESLSSLVDAVNRSCKNIDKPYEIILVDDGSIDEPGLLLKRQQIPILKYPG